WAAVYLHSSAEVQGRVFNPLLPALCLCLWQGLQTFCRFRTAALCMAILFLGNVAQSTGYWLLIDRPRAVEAQREWPVVERLAEFLRDNRQPVAISNRVEHAVWLMLQLTLDREIQHPLTRRISQPEPQWFVALRSEPIVKDGEPRFFAGDYAVFALPQSRVAQLPSARR
ncbi:MAG TPA: hypothetical protein VGP63_19220, partial [Planctomycetaceae bacterium]|nr:hypothetical protein [Planctomycetaceae bacterium]